MVCIVFAQENEEQPDNAGSREQLGPDHQDHPNPDPNPASEDPPSGPGLFWYYLLYAKYTYFFTILDPPAEEPPNTQARTFPGAGGAGLHKAEKYIDYTNWGT